MCLKTGGNVSLLLQKREKNRIFAPKNVIQALMSTDTLIILLAVAVLVLTAIVLLLLWHAYRQERHLKSKNEAIVREMHRCDQVIERAVKHGVSRAALL